VHISIYLLLNGDLLFGAVVFVNHKPAFGLQPALIRWAFDVLGGSIDRGELLHLLQTRGLSCLLVTSVYCLGLPTAPDMPGHWTGICRLYPVPWPLGKVDFSPEFFIKIVQNLHITTRKPYFSFRLL